MLRLARSLLLLARGASRSPAAAFASATSNVVGRRHFSAQAPSDRPNHCVCGLHPCLAPHCFASDAWHHWSGSFASDERSLAPYQGPHTGTVPPPPHAQHRTRSPSPNPSLLTSRALTNPAGTPDAVAAALFRLARFRTGERFVDLGAGDGRVLLFAVERLGAARATGYELDPAARLRPSVSRNPLPRPRVSMRRAGRALSEGVHVSPATPQPRPAQVHAVGAAHVAARLAARPDLLSRVALLCADARDADLSAADVVGIYLLPEGMRVLKPMLEERLPRGKGVRVVTHAWGVPGWAPDEEATTESGARLFLYRR